jgi:glutamyl-tRNA synthetase
VDAVSLSDPVLVRADGTYLYTLPSVVDDSDLGITHVIRGEDHVTNTAPQIQLFEALGATPPAFGHHNLLVGADGQALSKRDRSLAIEGLRAEGIEPLAVASYAAVVGTSDAVAPHASLDELVEAFDFAKLSRAPARFDPAELRLLNARLLHMLPFSAVVGRLKAMGVEGGENFWEAVRGNLAVLAEAKIWWDVVSGKLQPVIEDAKLCREAAALLPLEPWDETTWAAWSAAVKDATGAKGKALFRPLRLALTGREHGPELKALLPLIGRARALQRLEGKSA